MFQPTIDTHLLARHIHVQLPLTGAPQSDASLALLGAQVQAHQSSIPPFARIRRMLTSGRRPGPSTRPIHVPAR